jgi:Zn-dependent peptidase ImmA (M78 family)
VRVYNGFMWIEHIGINKNISWYEKRFAICHELWHKTLNHNRNHRTKLDEREADEKAFNMLVNDNELIEEFEKYEWDTSMLEKVFWVSAERIQKRISQIYNYQD